MRKDAKTGFILGLIIWGIFRLIPRENKNDSRAGKSGT